MSDVALFIDANSSGGLRPQLSGTYSVAVIYCSICGCPLIGDPIEKDPAWLADIVVAPVHESRFNAISVDYTGHVGPGASNAYTAWDDPPYPACFPLHRRCVELAALIVSAGTGPPFRYGGPPRSLNDVFYVLRARLEGMTARHEVHRGCWRLVEPCWYGGLDGFMGRDDWDRFPNVWLEDPDDIPLDNLKVSASIHDSTTYRLPPEILKIIMNYILEADDAPNFPTSIFSPLLWRDSVKALPFLKGIDLPEKCDWCDLAGCILKMRAGELVPGLKGLENRMRIWNLISNMQLNDNLDLRRAYCACQWDWYNGHCEVWMQEGEAWCEGSWQAWWWKKKDTLPENWIPKVADCYEDVFTVNDAGDLITLTNLEENTPLADYIIDLPINISYRTWRDSRIVSNSQK